MIALAGCLASPMSLARAQLSNPERDSVLFGLAVRAVRDSIGDAEYRVVLRPLASVPTIVYPTDGDFITPSAEALRARSDELKRLGIQSAPNVSRGECLGNLVPIMDTKPNGCPTRALVLAAFSMPRKGGAMYPDVVDESTLTDLNSRMAIRVIETALRPQGAITTAMDVVFALDQQRWVVQKIVKLHYVE
ncbi:MAG: hypothetical protein ABJB66_20400 [Gemmatimonadaceae bacterium]